MRSGLALSLVVFAVTARVDAQQAAPERQWRISICDGYLRGLDAEDIWSAAKSVGLSRLEVYPDRKLACPNLYEKDGAPYRLDTPEARAKLRAKLEAEKMTIGCLSLPVPLAPDQGDDEMLAWVRAAAEAAPDVGCRLLMIPLVGRGFSDEAFVERHIAFVRKLEALAEEARVQIAIENLSVYWNRKEILDPVLKSVRADRVGLALDITNMY